MELEVYTRPKREATRKALEVPDELLDAVAERLATLNDDQYVIVAKADPDGKPFKAESQARTHARQFADVYQEAYGDDDAPRLLSTNVIPGKVTQSGPNKGKVTE